MTDEPAEGEPFYLLFVRASTDPNKPTDIERLITELKGVQTACYYLASILREMDPHLMVYKEDE